MTGQYVSTWQVRRNEQAGDSENLPDCSEGGFSTGSQIRTRGEDVRIFQGSLDNQWRGPRVKVWNESTPESRIVQGQTFQGRDWKCGLGQMGKGRTIGDEYRVWKSRATNRRIFWRAGRSGDEASQSVGGVCGT